MTGRGRLERSRDHPLWADCVRAEQKATAYKSGWLFAERRALALAGHGDAEYWLEIAAGRLATHQEARDEAVALVERIYVDIDRQIQAERAACPE